MGEDLDSQYTERSSRVPDDPPPYGPPRLGVPAMVLIAGGIVLALGAGVLAFVVTRDPPAPTAEVTATPVPVPTVPVLAETAPQIAAPAPTDPFGPDPTPTAPTAPMRPPPPTATPAPSPTATSGLVLAPGNPAGSGCTPGPGASLPDGQWAGYIVEHDSSVMQFDLACFNSTTGVVSNENTALREVRLAPDVSVMCGTLTCDLSHIRASTLTAIEVVGGVAQRVRAGVGTSRPPTPSASPTDAG